MNKAKTKIKIMDLGFTFLKKYCALLAGYSNKGPYTAPEHLVQKGQVVENATEASDIYSFGIMLAEMFSGEAPFKHMTLNDIKIEVLEEKSRPALPSKLPDALRSLIERCWDAIADERPSFVEIEDSLDSIINQTKLKSNV